MMQISIAALMLVLGVATHWLKQLSAARKLGGHVLSARDYWFRYWPETLIAVSASVAGFAYLFESDSLSGLTAWGAGYMGNSIADILGTRVKALVSGPADPAPK